MPALEKQECTSLGDLTVAMNHDEVSRHLDMLDPRWQYKAEDAVIEHSFVFKNYYQTMAFANVVAQVAHQQDHHPVMILEYRNCTVQYSTHSAGGISIKDFICAAKINAAMKL